MELKGYFLEEKCSLSWKLFVLTYMLGLMKVVMGI